MTLMLWLRIVGWALTSIGSFALLTPVGQPIFNLGVVLVLFSLMVSKQEKRR